MKTILFVFISYITLQIGISVGYFVADYYDDFIDRKTTERIKEIQSKGKPAYCSFFI